MKNSIKAGRKKREVGEGEALEPVFQHGPIDYEELLQSLNEDFPYLLQNQAEKRFLGELSVNLSLNSLNLSSMSWWNI